MTMQRKVLPELLDSLSPERPEAIRSRRDLRRVNWWMSSSGLVARLVAQHSKPRSIVELGCGDGTLLLDIVRRLPRPTGRGRLTLLDRHPVVASATAEAFQPLGWIPETVTADVFAWMEEPGAPADAIISNLFLHHFEEPELRRLLHGASTRTDSFIALDPHRGWWPLFGCCMLRLLGCNEVTRNDATVSVRAGFSGPELSRLWPDPENWKLEERSIGLFSHGFVARRIGQ
jgi:SAM-dependent methyltransferase